ncbi:hypothetical protein [Saccharomonospora sp. CUA-673]|uniref:hypothetical protein n=1 Tax=Saccharomonospora sp. CUA-673 TaxID=1904969 RepID=UPI001115206F|nr:hypothetical protein [Saccharomonospora sp. CUA-673]
MPLGLALTAFTVLEEDWMGELRFATPIWILGALVTVLVTTEAFRRMRVRGRVVAIVALVVALVGTGATFVNAANDFRANPTLSACHVADRYGRAFNGYADTLGLQQASLFMPDLGGSSMTSRLEIVDMAGLTNIEMAHLISDREYDEIRDYVFEETRPTFIHTRLPWHSLRDDERLQRDYHQIYALPGDDAWPDGDWVRKDAVPNREALQRVRDYADEVTVPLMNYLHDPLRACGDTMHVGSTPPRSD